MIRPASRLPAALIAAVAVAAGAAACGGDEQRRSDAESEREQRADPRRTITGGRTTLALDGATARLLDGLGVQIRPAGAAKARGGRRIDFPITGGRVDLDTLEGRIRHDGALRLGVGGVGVVASELVIRPGRGVMTARIAGRRVPLLSLDFGRPAAPPRGRPVTLSAAATTLSPEALRALGVPLAASLEDGLRLGRVRLEATT